MKSEMPTGARSGMIAWSCPSNIALVKYWGKKPGQIPMNPSLSMTLQMARSIMNIEYSYDHRHENRVLRFKFEGKENPAFEARIRKYLDEIETFLPFLSRTHLAIESENSFPHSSGIASSASSMGALALGLIQLEEDLTAKMDGELFRQRASFLARLGSGSAARSIYPQFALWGRTGLWQHSSDEYAVPVKGLHKNFLNLRDFILLVDSGPKSISSSSGHSLMETNPFAKARYRQAAENLRKLKTALEEGDWQGFISIMEEEALTLHAMMMTGRPGYLLFKPGTLSILQLIREFREESGCRLGFTLDAGANVHLLFDGADSAEIETFVRSDLIRYCEGGKVIRDRIGSGPEKIEP